MNLTIYQAFEILKAGRPLPGTKVKSKTHGTMLLDGRPYEVNKPFAILNYLKAQKIKGGAAAHRLKIVSVYL